MSTPGYEVDLAQLGSHAERVADIAERVGKAKEAADEVGLGGVDVYGLLCSPLMIPALQLFQSDMDELVSSAAELADGLSGAIKARITDYQSLEAMTESHLGKIQESL